VLLTQSLDHRIYGDRLGLLCRVPSQVAQVLGRDAERQGFVAPGRAQGRGSCGFFRFSRVERSDFGRFCTRRATLIHHRFDLRTALKNIAVPTLLLSGSKDNNAPAPMMAKMATYIPGARYVELEGVGHLANMERPKAFNAALDRFLNTTGTPAS